MKNIFDQMKEDPDFVEFMQYIKSTANFFVATHRLSEEEMWAIKLILAGAYKAGMESKE